MVLVIWNRRWNKPGTLHAFISRNCANNTLRLLISAVKNTVTRNKRTSQRYTWRHHDCQQLRPQACVMPFHKHTHVMLIGNGLPRCYNHLPVTRPERYVHHRCNNMILLGKMTILRTFNITSEMLYESADFSKNPACLPQQFHFLT
jgi:hypothetical protein